MTGVCPLGAQVRARVGRSDRPDSSMKTISRLSRWAFFERRPGALLPVRDGFRIALDGALLRLLAGETHGAQNAPDSDVAVPDAEAPLDQRMHALEHPQVGAVSNRHRPGQQGLAQFLYLLGGHDGGATALAHRP